MSVWIRGITPRPREWLEDPGMAQRSETSLVGRTLSHYRVLDRLGAGGMGEVFLAEDARLKRKVALKVLPSSVACDPSRLERFQREAETVAALNHPNIVTLFSVEEAEGIHFLTMECVEGEPLARHIPPEGLELGRYFDIALPLVDAVAAAHEQGITHRDLNPANVMVGTDGRIRVIDFGLAKTWPRSNAAAARPMAEVTEAGTIVGTFPYMSPEQVQGMPVDPRTDVFALGTISYELLTGRRPFQGDSAIVLLTSILRDDPVPVSSVRKGIPDSLDGVVRRCMAKRPQDRYRNARELGIDLKRIRCEVVADAWSGTAAAPATARSIAVLPFQNLSADYSHDYFGEGIAEDIINALVLIKTLHVAARSSSSSFKGSTLPIGDIASRLHVRHVLEGSVRTAGDRVRITAQLVDAEYGYSLWSERYDRHLDDIFDIQDEIARKIVGRLQAAFDGSGTRRLVKSATRNTEAYQLYLKGRAMLYRRGPDLARSEELLWQAVALDPVCAQAWAALAQALAAQAFYGLRRAPDLMSPALHAARRAAECNSELSAVRACTVHVCVGTHDRATFRSGAGFGPAGRGSRPRLVRGTLAAGQRAALDAAPRRGGRDLRRPSRDIPPRPWAVAGLAATYADMGRSREARASYDELVARRTTDYVLPTMLAVAACAAGELDQAFAWAHEAIDPPDALLFSLARHFPDLEPMRRDPRFESLLRRVCQPLSW